MYKLFVLVLGLSLVPTWALAYQPDISTIVSDEGGGNTRVVADVACKGLGSLSIGNETSDPNEETIYRLEKADDLPRTMLFSSTFKTDVNSDTNSIGNEVKITVTNNIRNEELTLNIVAWTGAIYEKTVDLSEVLKWDLKELNKNIECGVMRRGQN